MRERAKPSTVPRWFASLAFALVVVTAAGAAGSGGWRHVVLGLCEDYPEETRSVAAARADLAFAHQVGATVLRVGIGWDAVEAKRGVYDWEFWDEYLSLAAAQGIAVIPYVCYTPQWAARDQGPDYWRSPPRETDDFRRFMTAIARHDAGRVRSWELWNEPDNPAYWRGSAADFAALVRAGSAGVRAGDPHAQVVLGGIATQLGFLTTLLRDEKLGPAIDVVNVHAYFETWHPDPIESLPRFLAAAQAAIDANAPGKALWLAETGYSSVGPRAAVSDVYRARFVDEHTNAAQAAALSRTLILALASGAVRLAAWYRINDLAGGTAVIGDDNNRRLGLRDLHGAPKPAQLAFAQISRWFAGGYRVVPAHVSAVPGSDPAEVHAFDLADGRRLVAVWLAMRGSSGGGEPVADRRRADVTIRLPAPSPGAMEVTDSAGAERLGVAGWEPDENGGALTVHCTGGRVLFCVLSPAPHEGSDRHQRAVDLSAEMHR